MAAAAQAESLAHGVNPPLPGVSKGSIDGETILNLKYQYNYYLSLVSMSNRYIQVLFAVRLL